jgi:hypothetical protein
MIVAIVDESNGRLTPEQLDLMVEACNRQVHRDFAPAYGLLPLPVQLFQRDQVPHGSLVVVLFENRDAIAAGSEYFRHVQEAAQESPNFQNVPDWAVGVGIRDKKGLSYARVFVQETIEVSDGDPLKGPRSTAYSLSHEVLEGIGDPFINRWAVGVNNRKAYAYEVCDPVEGLWYEMELLRNGQTVEVSVCDFVTPQWFNAAAREGPFDFRRGLPGPFSFSDAGYQLVHTLGDRDSGEGQETFLETKTGRMDLDDPLKDTFFSRTRWRRDGADKWMP